jgi:hypothetical protein
MQLYSPTEYSSIKWLQNFYDLLDENLNKHRSQRNDVIGAFDNADEDAWSHKATAEGITDATG